MIFRFPSQRPKQSTSSPTLSRPQELLTVLGSFLSSFNRPEYKCRWRTQLFLSIKKPKGGNDWPLYPDDCNLTTRELDSLLIFRRWRWTRKLSSSGFGSLNISVSMGHSWGLKEKSEDPVTRTTNQCKIGLRVVGLLCQVVVEREGTNDSTVSSTRTRGVQPLDL